MENLKIWLWLLFAVCVLIYSGNPEFKLNPFSLTFKSWKMMVALFCFAIGFSLYSSHIKETASKKAIKDTVDYVKKIIKEEIN